MPCIITDKADAEDSNPLHIPQKPVCRPKEIQEKKGSSLAVPIAVFISVIVICSCITGIDSLEDTFIGDAAGWGIVISIPALILLSFLQYCLDAVNDFKLRSKLFNPEGYSYQGKALAEDNPHYRLHLEYFKKRRTWELPDNIKCLSDIDEIKSIEEEIDEETFSDEYFDSIDENGQSTKE